MSADITRAGSAPKVARERSLRKFVVTTGGRLLRKMMPGDGRADAHDDHDDQWGAESVAESEVPLYLRIQENTHILDPREYDRTAPRALARGRGGGQRFY